MKELAVLLLALLIASTLSGCEDKGTYNAKLTQQYIRATNYAIINGRLVPGVGVTLSVYLDTNSNKTVNIYSTPVVQNPKTTLLKKATINNHGIINIGWNEANDSVKQAWNETIPRDGSQFFFYTNFTHNSGYNVIIYKINIIDQKNQVVDSQYAILYELGWYENGVMATYTFR